MIRALVALLVVCALMSGARAQPFGSDELIAKARAEGRVVLYSVNFNETEQAWIGIKHAPSTTHLTLRDFIAGLEG